MANEDTWEVICSYPVAMEAQLALSILKSNDIDARIFDENASQLMPHLSSILSCRLAVRKSQAAEALSLLETLRIPDSELEKESDESEAKALPSEKVVRSDLDRAFKTAVYGFIFLPGLSGIVALYFLYKHATREKEMETSKASMKYFFSFLFSIAGIILVAVFLRSFWQKDANF